MENVNEDLIGEIGKGTWRLWHAFDRRRSCFNLQAGETGEEFAYR
jgi:hypothetical protein